MIAVEPAFQKKYRALNKAQKEAVDTIQGQVMVVAGPGTGKTTILTLRIANILLKTDTPPDAILALTFSESGAYAMREKLAELIGSMAYRVRISTFHSFGSDIIQNHPGSFSRIVGGRPANEIDQLRILEEIIRTNSFKEIKPFGDMLYYVRPALEAIANLKKEDFDPEKFGKWLRAESSLRKKIAGGKRDPRREARTRELLKVFRLYEKALRRKKLYDYDDMLVETLKVLKKDKNLLSEIRENCHYILTDEHQDTNGIQNALLEQIAGDEPDLFIVGDEKQAIYRFQGASLENFLYFKKRFPAALLIVLRESYRSNQEILDTAFRVAEKLPGAGEIPRPRLRNPNSKPASRHSLREFSFPDAETEAKFVASEIGKINRGMGNGIRRTETKSIGVFVRTNAQISLLSKNFEEAEIAFLIRADQNIFDDPDFHNFFSYLEAVNDPTDNENLAEAMLADFSGLDPLDSFKIFRTFRRKENFLIDALLDPEFLRKAKTKPASVLKFAERIKSLASEARNFSLLPFLDKIVAESGFRNKLISSEKNLAKLERLSAFYGAARSFAENNRRDMLPDFISFLKSARNFNVRLPALARPTPYRPVELMTAHKAKGLEFDAVFVVGATDRLWGNRRSPRLFGLPPEAEKSGGSGEEADERRLFYVAITRARHTLSISRPLFGADGKPLAGSRFLADLDPELLEKKVFEDVSLLTLAGRAALPKKKENGRPGKKERAYLREIFLSEGLNVSALNNYLDCPWKFFFQNLIRLPKAPEKHQEFGSAIHETLKIFQNEIRTGKPPMVSRLIGLFRLLIAKRNFENRRELAAWRLRGEKALKIFFENHLWRSETIPEFSIGGIKFVLPGGEALNLRGILDEVVFYPDSRVEVTDFKTGKPKSRNEILGKTKNSKGAIFRQLVFYKLLLEEMKRDLQTEKGIIEFVEPNSAGKFRREEFILGREDVDNLREEIRKVAEEILSFSFWNKRCDNTACEFCELAKNL